MIVLCRAAQFVRRSQTEDGRTAEDGGVGIDNSPDMLADATESGKDWKNTEILGRR